MPVKKSEPVEIDDWSDKQDAAPDWAAERTAPSKARPCNFTLKGKGSSDSWLVIYYDTTEDALEVLEDPRLDDLMDAIAAKNEEFQGRFKASGGFSKPAAKSSGGWGGKKPAAKASRSSEPTYSDDYDCEHGERDWVSKGTWQAWMCPSDDRDDKCDPLWANKDGSLQKKR